MNCPRCERVMSQQVFNINKGDLQKQYFCLDCHYSANGFNISKSCIKSIYEKISLTPEVYSGLYFDRYPEQEKLLKT